MKQTATLLLLLVSLTRAVTAQDVPSAPTAETPAPPVVQNEPWGIVTLKSLERTRGWVQRISVQLPDLPFASSMRQLEQFPAIPGLDPTRPIVLLVRARGKTLEDPLCILALPVTDTSLFLALCAQIPDLKIEKLAENQWRIRRGSKELGAAEFDQRLLVTNHPEFLNDPAWIPQWLPSGTVDNDVSICIRPAGIPAEIQHGWSRSLAREIEKLRQKSTTLPENDGVLLRAIAEFSASCLKRWRGGTRQIELNLLFDSNLEFDVSWFALPDSKLSQDLAEIRLQAARIERIPDSGRPTAAEATFAVDFPPPIRELMSLGFARIWEHVSQEVGPRIRREDWPAASGASDMIAATIETGRLEAHLAFVPSDGKHMVLYGSVAGQKSERLSESLVTVLPYAAETSKVREVRINAVRQGSLSVHQILPKKISADDRMLYGDNSSLYMGTNSYAFLFAVGGESVPPVLTGLEPSSLESPDLVALSCHLRPWLVLLAQSRKEDQDRFQKLLEVSPEADPQDEVALRIRSLPDQLQLSFKFESGVQRMIQSALHLPSP